MVTTLGVTIGVKYDSWCIINEDSVSRIKKYFNVSMTCDNNKQSVQKRYPSQSLYTAQQKFSTDFIFVVFLGRIRNDFLKL